MTGIVCHFAIEVLPSYFCQMYNYIRESLKSKVLQSKTGQAVLSIKCKITMIEVDNSSANLISWQAVQKNLKERWFFF